MTCDALSSSFLIANRLCEHPLKRVKDGPEHQACVTPMKYKTTGLKRSRTGDHLRCLPDNQFRTKWGLLVLQYIPAAAPPLPQTLIQEAKK